MRKIVASVCAIALLAPLPVGSTETSSQTSDRRSVSPPQQYELCRRPAALPNLGAERESQQNQQSVRRGRTGSVSSGRMESEMAMAPPVSAPVSAPPPPPSVASAYADAAGSSARESRSMPGYPRPPIPGPRPRPTPQPQSGLLTAGEHDDLLNPELYADYVRKSGLGQSARGLPRLDTNELLTIVAKDRRGRSMPFVPVEVRCADGNSITLQTVADGSSVFFPGLDRLGNSVQVRAGNSNWRTVDLSSARGTQTISFTLRGQAQAVRKLDLALVVDVTGSMSDELQFLQAELTSIVDALNRRHRNLDIRVGFTFYRDQGDQFVTRTFPLSSNIIRAKGHIAKQSANGGGDYEEAMQDALIRSAGQPWRDDAVKTLLLVADAPPHNRDVEMTWRAAEHLRAERVHIVPVGASGVADMAEYLMRAMAASTQSRYTFLTDDSGIGNSHAEPSVDCYLVTRLDALLRRTIDSQISGRRIEPERGEIIRSVGQYDAGRCILPANYQRSQ